MKASDQAMGKLLEALAAEIGRCDELELELGELIGKYRRKHDREVTDRETARLLPLGIAVATERAGCHRSTIYRRVSRAQKVARLPPRATTPA